MRLVLDSNVWLDWLHFDDPGIEPLKKAKHDDAVEIVIDAPCRDELERVLGYERFGLNETSQSSLLREADRLCTFLDHLRYAPAEQLPWCSDPDDIKFLALADACRADWLITKDNALLGKRRRTRSSGTRYRVATPEQWSLSEEISGD